MSKPDPLFQQGHRKRLADKLMSDKITDYELLEYILTLAVPRRSMRLVARNLLKRFRTFNGVMCAPTEYLQTVDGVGPACIRAIKAMHMAANVQSFEAISSGSIFKNYEELNKYCKFTIGGNAVEEFHILYLRADFSLIEDKMHSHGSVESAPVYPTEILKMALILNATSVLMVHNHPSGRAGFSEEDITTTMQVKEVLEKNNIQLFDHFVVTPAALLSMVNSQLLNQSGAVQSPAPDDRNSSTR